jgi:Domain of unknown function (DUF1937)
MMKLIYLACPYSHESATVREARFVLANAAAAVLMRAGLYVFSPISHTHPIAQTGGLPLGWDYWEGYDREILSHCGALVVLAADGWKESTGVSGEIRIALDLGIPGWIEPMEELGNPEFHEALRACVEITGETAAKEKAYTK